MSRLRTRMLAAGATFAVAAAVALPATAPAFSEPLGTTFSVTADNLTPLPGSDVVFTATFDGLPPSCAPYDRPSIEWTGTYLTPDGVTPVGGTMTSGDAWNADGVYLEYRYVLEDILPGATFEFAASSADDCFPDGETYSDSVTVTSAPLEEDDSEEPYVYAGEDTVTGVVYVQSTVDPTDFQPAEGVEVNLIDVGTWNVVDSTDTDQSGSFALSSLVEESADEDIPYVIEALVDGDAFYYAPGADADHLSPADSDGADTLMPMEFDAEVSYDFYVGRAPVSQETTNLEAICDYEGNSSGDYTTSSALFEDVCHTDPSVDDAETGDRDDAFDSFGYVAFAAPGASRPDGGDYDEEGYYFVTADTRTVGTDDDAYVFSLRDDDVPAYTTDGSPVLVDVVVTRRIEGSWMTWSVTVYLADTTTVASDVPFFFVGELGSDSDTTWDIRSNVAVSTDGRDSSDPVLAHRFVASGSFVVDEDEISLDSRGTLSYAVGLFDYTECTSQALVDAAFASLNGAGTVYSVLPVLEGTDCGVALAWTIAAPTFTVGTAYDRTFTAPAGGAWSWDWSYGGGIELYELPDGLEWEVIGAWEDDTAPAVRIFGTPTTAGPYSFLVYLEDDEGSDIEFAVSGTVRPAGAPPVGDTDPEFIPEDRDLDLKLDFSVGDQVSGSQATATAEGLEEGADFDIVVRSTPQTLAAGTVPTGGVVTRSVTLPTLEAGWHSLTFTSTWAGGGTAVAKLWFQVGADGTLLAVSSSAPVGLANTGADIGGSVALASFALLLGFGMVAFRRRRSARV